MASTVLEATRAAHEDLERLERLAVRELQRDPANARDRLFQSHRVRHMLDLVVSTSDKLVEIYEDKDNARKDDIYTHLTAPTQSGMFSKYYERLKEIRDYHRRNASARFVSTTGDYEELLKEEPVIEFTGEEAFGRYLDLHELYNEFINSKFGAPMEYSAYVGTFSQTDKITQNHKATRQYKDYLEHILEYLTSFMYRTEPLQDTEKIFTKLESEFEERWANGESPVPQESEIDLDYYSTVDELIELGPEKLKEALASHGLKSGGTVQQRAERLFLLKHTPLAQLDRKHFAKVSRNSVSNIPSNGNNFKDDLKKEIALMEVKMRRLCELLDEEERLQKEIKEGFTTINNTLADTKEQLGEVVQQLATMSSRLSVVEQRSLDTANQPPMLHSGTTSSVSAPLSATTINMSGNLQSGTSPSAATPSLKATLPVVTATSCPPPLLLATNIHQFQCRLPWDGKGMHRAC